MFEPVHGNYIQKAVLLILDFKHDPTCLGIDYTFIELEIIQSFKIFQ